MCWLGYVLYVLGYYGLGCFMCVGGGDGGGMGVYVF